MLLSLVRFGHICSGRRSVRISCECVKKSVYLEIVFFYLFDGGSILPGSWCYIATIFVQDLEGTWRGKRFAWMFEYAERDMNNNKRFSAHGISGAS